MVLDTTEIRKTNIWNNFAEKCAIITNKKHGKCWFSAILNSVPHKQTPYLSTEWKKWLLGPWVGMQLAVKKTEIDFEAMFENGIYAKKDWKPVS